MSAVIRSEWIKLRMIRTHWVLAALALVFPLVVVSLAAALSSELGAIDDSEFAGLIGSTGVISAMLLATVAAISLTGEYTHNTIRPTYAATPSRTTVVLGKVAVVTAMVLAVIVIVITVTWGVGALILAGRGDSVGLSLDDGSVGALAGLIMLAVIVGWFGLGLGLLLRNAPATVSILLLWPLLAEGILTLVLTIIGSDDLTRWLPYQAAIEAVMPSPGSESLGRPGAWIWFGGLTWVLLAVGIVLDQRRDA